MLQYAKPYLLMMIEMVQCFRAVKSAPVQHRYNEKLIFGSSEHLVHLFHDRALATLLRNGPIPASAVPHTGRI